MTTSAQRAANGHLPPGPRAPRLVQTARWMARPLGLLEACARRHGDFFTLKLGGLEPVVFTSDADAIKALLATDRDNLLPPGRNFILEPVLGPRSVLLLEGEEHLRRRRLMLPAFHGERMRAYEGLIATITEREVERWTEGARFRLHPRFQAITLEVILSAVFGVGEGDRRERLRVELGRLLTMTSAPGKQAIGLATRRLGRWGPYRRLLVALERIDALLAAEIAERRADPGLGEREDILSMMIAARFDDGSAMDDSELRDQLMTLLLAGHETTATALAWTFDLLFRHPEVEERLRAELDAEDGNGAGPYLDAVVNESLRLRPVIPNFGRRLTAPSRLGGRQFAAGADILPCIYLLHMRDDVYPEARAFRPERFLDAKPDTYAWLPFGGGVRRCLGAAFAQFEMRVVIATMLRRVRLRPASDRPEGVARRNVTLSPRRGAPAILVERISRSREPSATPG